MIAPMRQQFDDILAHPPTVPTLEFKGEGADSSWSWCDSLFMAPPAWARLYYATGDERYLNFAVTNWWRTTDYLYDTNEHLFFRDSTYFTKREANGKKVILVARQRLGDGRPRPHSAISADESSRPSALRATIQGHVRQNPDVPAAGWTLAREFAGPGQLSA